MKITKYPHSCVMAEEAGARILIDPGSFSPGAEEVTGLTAIFITHQHGDHMDLDKVKALAKNNPDVQVVADEQSAELLQQEGIQATAVKHGDTFDVGGVPVAVFGEWHVPIHSSLPNVKNVGYLIGGRFFHPGDSFTNPEAAVEILAFVAAAPFAKVQDSVDHVNAVKPKIAVPIHEKVSSNPAMLYNMMKGVISEGIELMVIEDGQTVEV